MIAAKNYINAIDDSIGKQGSILPSSLKGFAPIDGDFTPYQAYPGGYCIVYPLVCEGKPKMCIRLWHKDFNKDLVKTLANTLKDLHTWGGDFIIGYEYFEEGLKLEDGEVIPAVVMEWIEGETLMSWIQKNKDNPTAVKRLANEFYGMCSDMHREGLAHGDLSADNIMVKPDGKMVLIDYDSFYAPTLPDNIRQTIAGTPGYQHRDRAKLSYISADMDNFSQQVIYVSLLAIACNPALADESLNLVADKKMFFDAKDFTDDSAFVSSEGYKAIEAINNKEVKERLEELRRAVNGNLEEVSSIVEYNSIIAKIQKDNERLRKELEEKSKAANGGTIGSGTNTNGTGSQSPITNPPGSGQQPSTPWYKRWYAWAGIAAVLASIWFFIAKPSDGTSGAEDSADAAAQVDPETAKAIATAIERIEGNYALRERVNGELVNGIRTCAIKKNSDSHGQILVTSEYGPEFYDFTFDTYGNVSSEKLGTGEITYKEKLDKVTITFKQGERVCEFTK